MNQSPAFQFYAADYLADANVQKMTAAQEGHYIRLLAYCWREGSIDSDPRQMALLLKSPSEEDLRVVQARFIISPNDASKLIHKRLEIEREKQNEWAEKSRMGGIKSAEARSKKLKAKKLQGVKKIEPPLPFGSNQTSTNGQPNGNSSSSSSIYPVPCTPAAAAAKKVAGGDEQDLTQLAYQLSRLIESEIAGKIVNPKERRQTLLARLSCDTHTAWTIREIHQRRAECKRAIDLWKRFTSHTNMLPGPRTEKASGDLIDETYDFLTEHGEQPPTIEELQQAMELVV